MEFQVVDKRHFADPDNISIDKIEEEKPRYPTYVEELLARVSETERRFEEKKQQIDEEIARTRERLAADFDRRLDLAQQKIILPFLDILDNLERALHAASQADNAVELRKGVELTRELFLSRLQALGIERLEVLHQPFDPNLSQAIGIVPVENSDQNGLVLEEALPGYRMGDQLLRPAQVKVRQN